MNQYICELIIAIVQGVTEAFPISSSMHVKIASDILGFCTSKGFDTFMHISSLIAFTVFFRKEVLEMILGIRDFALHRKISDGLELFIKLFISAIPCTAIEIIAKMIEFSPKPSIILGIIMSSVLFASTFINGRKTCGGYNYRDAVLAGVLQAFAFIPGASRLGSCITGLLFLKYKRADAIRIAFLMGLPSSSGAIILGFRDVVAEGAHIFYLFLIAMVAASLTFFMIRVFIKWKNGIRSCAIYRIELFLIVCLRNA